MGHLSYGGLPSAGDGDKSSLAPQNQVSSRKCWFESDRGHQTTQKALKYRYFAGSPSFVATKLCYGTVMDMAKPRGMFLRGATWWARKDVPKELRAIIGQTSLQKTLETGDCQIANVRFHAVMQGFEARIAQARKQLAGQAPEVITIDIDPQWADAAWRWEQRKPENQIRTMLQQAKLIPEKRRGAKLDVLFEQWVKERQPTPNGQKENARAKALFIELNGDLASNKYTTEHARKWKDYVLDRKFKGKPLAHASREKMFNAVADLFRFADRNDLLSANPFAKIKLETPKRAKANQRQEWDREELWKLFASPVFTEGKRFIAGGGEAAYWLPVLSLYHGFRAGELCQLDRNDLVQRDGIWCLRIRPSDDEEDAKSVKTTESIRTVPLHKRLIELGFLDYVKTLKGTKMFPEIAPDSRGRWSGDYSKWFGRYRRSIGLDQRWTDFHSFRHTWKTAARGAELREDYHDEISGDDSASVGRSYGRIPIKVLKRALDKVRFDVTIPKWKLKQK
jgi:integrase